MSKNITVKVTVKVKTSSPNGVILYRGHSLLDGKPIVVIATGLYRKSKNPKTGDMIGTYILADDGENPIAAVKSGGDSSVCGDCPHRGKSCYVNVAQAPLAIYKAFKNGSYPKFSVRKHLGLFSGRFVRLGSYGDPAAVPMAVWERILKVADGHTGYTHQWRKCDQSLAKVCMASCDTEFDREEAVAMGWRTFRIRKPEQEVMPGEFVCPASEEGGRRLTCAECRACSGVKDGGKNVSPVIIWHGPKNGAGQFAYRQYEATVERLNARRFALPTLN